MKTNIMKELKIIVALLCKHLNVLWDTNVQPELFRLAKFNKLENNVVSTFWQLLRRILNLPASENTVKEVKMHFLTILKYKNPHFYALPEDMSMGSRELLLAFAYLMGKDYINRHVMDLVGKSLFNPTLKLENKEECKTKTFSFNLKQIKSDRDFKNMLQWIEGRTVLNQRETQEYQDNFQKLWLKKENANAAGILKIPTLSEVEVAALCNDKDGKEFLEKTEKVYRVIHNHLLWLQVQSDFWDWMSSVIIERQKTIKNINTQELNIFTDNI